MLFHDSLVQHCLCGTHPVAPCGFAHSYLLSGTLCARTIICSFCCSWVSSLFVVVTSATLNILAGFFGTGKHTSLLSVHEGWHYRGMACALVQH